MDLLRYLPEWQGRTRWDLYAFPDPRQVCALCRFFLEAKQACINSDRLENSEHCENLTDNLVYSCDLFQFPCSKEIATIYLISNPLANLSGEEQKSILEKMRNAIDLSIQLRASRSNKLSGIEMQSFDSIDPASCKILKTSIKVYGFLRERWRIFRDFPDLLYNRKAGFYSIPRKRILEVTVIQNGSSKKMQRDEFEQFLEMSVKTSNENETGVV